MQRFVKFDYHLGSCCTVYKQDLYLEIGLEWLEHPLLRYGVCVWGRYRLYFLWPPNIR